MGDNDELLPLSLAIIYDTSWTLIDRCRTRTNPYTHTHVPTLTSLKLSASVAIVEFTTDGLFLTLGKMIPPLRDTAGLAAVPLPCGIALMFGTAVEGTPVAPVRLTFTLTVLLLLPVGVVDGYVVIGSGGSVKSSNIANLGEHTHN